MRSCATLLALGLLVMSCSGEGEATTNGTTPPAATTSPGSDMPPPAPLADMMPRPQPDMPRPRPDMPPPADDMDSGDQDRTPDMSEDMPADTPPDMPPAPLGQALLYAAQIDGKITVYEVDEATLALTERGTLDQGGRISFMALDPGGEWLYACGARTVQSFRLDAATGVPTFVDEREVLDNGNGTHLTIDATNSYVIAASYGGGEAVVVPVGMGGTFGMPGFRANCQRAHQARVHPSNTFAYVPCLGDNKILVWQFDPQNGNVIERPDVMTAPGAGPRHMDFSPDGSKAYVLMEVNSTIEVFDVDQASGDLTRIQTISTVPAGEGASKSSDIRVSADGRLVYAVNRTPRNEIVWFAVDPADGQLTELGRLATQGQEGRSIAVDQRLRFLFAAYNDRPNGDGGLLSSFRIMPDGSLDPVDQRNTDDRLFFVGLRYEAP